MKFSVNSDAFKKMLDNVFKVSLNPQYAKDSYNISNIIEIKVCKIENEISILAFNGNLIYVCSKGIADEDLGLVIYESGTVAIESLSVKIFMDSLSAKETIYFESRNLGFMKTDFYMSVGENTRRIIGHPVAIIFPQENHTDHKIEIDRIDYVNNINVFVSEQKNINLIKCIFESIDDNKINIIERQIPNLYGGYYDQTIVFAKNIKIAI